ncbi:MAG: YegS/Rv2252/BmrU family lipid kinase [Lactobacillus sp.]|jgi:YegS/Rv2252/BmrU family lipid kinase|uniref:diacylglycerol/lipid kinase family protein n=1 Tax=Lacticaseibacillus suilingensis TaxID=2799577 RepID=UPI0036D26B92|nr:YegS/Rv2252/BmrU family lipid kinase [Lactobacillus sp.]
MGCEVEEIELIINEYAGNARTKKQIPALMAALAEQYTFATTTYTKQPGDARDAVAAVVAKVEAASVKPLVVVIGGDGTLHDVVNGLQALGQGDIPVGYIPNGTGNDFARAHGIPLDPFAAVAALKTARPHAARIGKAETEEYGTLYFLNNFGVGVDGGIVYDTNHSTSKAALNKVHLGQLSYTANILRAVVSQKAFRSTVKIDQAKTIDNTFLCVFTNHPFLGGGLRLFPDYAQDWHQLSFVLVRKEKWRLLIQVLMAILSGKSEHRKLGHVKAHRYEFSTDAHEHIQLDGEEYTSPVHAVLTQVDQTMLLPIQ